jgi:hypothetical protein
MDAPREHWIAGLPIPTITRQRKEPKYQTLSHTFPEKLDIAP